MSVDAIDLSLLRLLKYRDNYERLHRAVPKDIIDVSTAALLRSLGNFFKDNPNAEVAKPEDFWPFFRLANPRLKPEGEAVLSRMVKLMGEDVPDTVSNGILKRLQDARLASDMASMLERYQEGDEVSITQYLRTAADAIPPDADDIPYADTNIEALLAEDEDDWGFKWRLNCLNECMRPLRPGDFGILAARVDQGKGTTLVSELTFMAKQAEQLFGERRPILYLNNEGVGSRIVKRAYQAALGATNDELVKLSKQGVLRERYLEAMGGWESLIVVDVHDRPLSFLESVIQRTNPSLVAVDMLDVVPFDGTAMNGGTRTDQILEAAYQRARIWGVKYECAVIAASQLSADAAGEHFPTLGMLANSRTGKPGAADFILMLGSSADPLMADTRWISLPKNKLARRGRKDPRAMVQFDADRARVNNPETLIGA